MRSPNHTRWFQSGQCVPRQGYSVNVVTALALVLVVTLACVALPAQPASAAVISYTDLYTLGTPAGFTFIDHARFAQSAAGGQVVGNGYGSATGDNPHALLWTPSAPSGIDLNPTGFTYSYAFGASGTQQVGSGSGIATGNRAHALLWSGLAASAVDLNPAGFTNSLARANSGTQQVGFGYGHGLATGFLDHALLWSGSAASAVDLHPSGFIDTYAYGTNGTQQVGWGVGSATGNRAHALLWSGSAASLVDLHSVLPASFIRSEARSIDGGTIYGYARDTSLNYHAIAWRLEDCPRTRVACPPPFRRGWRFTSSKSNSAQSLHERRDGTSAAPGHGGRPDGPRPSHLPTAGRFVRPQHQQLPLRRQRRRVYCSRR